MRVNWSIIGRIILIVLAVIFAIYVWPTPYREYRFGNRIFQVNRFTGRVSPLLDGP
jgi:membrane protein YdbS with pleckstrin-like domain